MTDMLLLKCYIPKIPGKLPTKVIQKKIFAKIAQYAICGQLCKKNMSTVKLSKPAPYSNIGNVMDKEG